MTTTLTRPVATTVPAGYRLFTYFGTADDGWDIFEPHGAPDHAPYEIQWDQDNPRFEKDGDPAAWTHVVLEATRGSELHLAALVFLSLYSIDEIVNIVTTIWRDGPTDIPAPVPEEALA